MAAVAHPPAQRERSAGRQLTAVLESRGFHVFHDCDWPGVGPDRIDHVVVGPTGVWVVAEDAATGRAVKRAGAQADALRAALGDAPVRAIVSVTGPDAPAGTAQRSGVVVAGGVTATVDVIVDGAVTLRPGEVERLAAVVRADRQTAAPAKKKPTAKKKPSTRRGRRIVAAVVVVAVVAAGAWALLGRDTTPAPAPEVGAPATAPIVVTYECRHPTRGWTQVVRWPGLDAVRAVLVAPTVDGPWAFVPMFGPAAARDGVVPGERGVVRVQHGAGESVLDAQAPAEGC